MGLSTSMFLFVLSLFCQNTLSWDWFGSSASPNSEWNPPDIDPNPHGFLAEFSIDSPNNQKGLERVENAKKKLSGTNSCWVKAYQDLFSVCSEILNDNQKQQRLAWSLSDCFQRDSGGTHFPTCGPHSPIKDCLETLKGDARGTYLEFFLETNSICHELQAHTFRRQTERLVNDLKRSSELAEEKIDSIEHKAENLIQSSREIYDSLNSIDFQTRKVADSSKNAEDHIEVVLSHSHAIFEQSKGIASSQSQLQVGQEGMKIQMKEGMSAIHESYNSLDQAINLLKVETIEIEREIARVGDHMSLKMVNLQNKADEIRDDVGISLGKQKELLQVQSTTLEGLQFLTKHQSQALQESRDILQNIAEIGHTQQEELHAKQEQIQQAHDHLVQNSKSILAAQEIFESKQANMFVALERLFTLHNAMLIESRLIKSLFMYSISIFILYMFTSTKQTYSVRPRLYIGLAITFLIEFTMLRFEWDDSQRKMWIMNFARSFFAFFASMQLIHAVFTYRDYEKLNHRILLSLIEKVNGIDRNEEDLLYESDDELNWDSWIDSEIIEDLDELEDPNFVVRQQFGKNFIPTATFARTYDLRHR